MVKLIYCVAWFTSTQVFTNSLLLNLALTGLKVMDCRGRSCPGGPEKNNGHCPISYVLSSVIQLSAFSCFTTYCDKSSMVHQFLTRPIASWSKQQPSPEAVSECIVNAGSRLGQRTHALTNVPHLLLITDDSWLHYREGILDDAFSKVGVFDYGFSQ